MAPLLLGLAIVAKSNKPILVISTGDEPLVKLHFTVYSSLDIVDERVASPPVLNYLGLLGLSGSHATYAMISGATCVKVFAVFDADAEPAPRDEDVRLLLSGVAAAYVDWACNPFVKLDKRGLAVVDDPVPLEGGTGVSQLRKRLSMLVQNFGQV